MKGSGIVTSLDGYKARVHVTTASECTDCPSRSHCHTGTTENREIVVLNDCDARISDHVVFEAESGKVVLSAVLIWIVPILAMIVGYRTAERFSGGFLPVGAAFLFLGIAFVFLRIVDSKISGGRTFYPHITSVVKASSSGSDDEKADEKQQM